MVDATPCDIVRPCHEVPFECEEIARKNVFILCITKKKTTHQKLHFRLIPSQKVYFSTRDLVLLHSNFVGQFYPKKSHWNSLRHNLFFELCRVPNSLKNLYCCWLNWLPVLHLYFFLVFFNNVYFHVYLFIEISFLKIFSFGLKYQGLI